MYEKDNKPGNLLSIDKDWWTKHADTARSELRDAKADEQKMLDRKRPKRSTVVELPPQHFSVQAIAERMGVDITTVYDAIAEGKLECQPWGKRKLITADALSKFLESQKMEFTRKKRRNG
jgi:excisionase family DNA binding protein